MIAKRKVNESTSSIVIQILFNVSLTRIYHTLFIERFKVNMSPFIHLNISFIGNIFCTIPHRLNSMLSIDFKILLWFPLPISCFVIVDLIFTCLGMIKGQQLAAYNIMHLMV